MKTGIIFLISILLSCSVVFAANTTHTVKVLNRDGSVIVFSPGKEDSILIMKSTDRVREIFMRLFPKLGNPLSDPPIVIYAKDYPEQKVPFFNIAFIMGITRPGARLDIRINGPVPALSTGVIRILFAMRLAEENNKKNKLAQNLPQWIVSAVWHHYRLTYRNLAPGNTNIIFNDTKEFEVFLNSTQKKPFENSQQAYFFLKYLLKNHFNTDKAVNMFFKTLADTILSGSPAQETFGKMGIDIHSLLLSYNQQYEKDSTIIPTGTHLDKLDTIWKLYNIFHFKLSPVTQTAHTPQKELWFYYADGPNIKSCCRQVLAKHIVTNTYTKLLKLKAHADPKAAEFINMYLSCVYTQKSKTFRKLFNKAEKMRKAYCQIMPDEINILRSTR